jgi:hypothetical protein
MLVEPPRARPTSGQDLGDGFWPVLAALLPRTAALQVTAISPPACLSAFQCSAAALRADRSCISSRGVSCRVPPGIVERARGAGKRRGGQRDELLGAQRRTGPWARGCEAVGGPVARGSAAAFGFPRPQATLLPARTSQCHPLAEVSMIGDA